LGARIDAAEKKNREALADLEANLGEATKRVENIENAKPSIGPLAPLPPEDGVTGSQLDLPPFPESPVSEADYQPTPGDVEHFSQAAPEPIEAFASELPPDPASPENYLAHARRAAQAAAEPELERGKRAKYRIPFPGEAELALAGAGQLKRTRRSSQPYAFAALLLLLVVSGYQITRNVFRESQVVALQLNRPAAPDVPSPTGPATTEKATGASDLSASAIPTETPAGESVGAAAAPPPAASAAASPHANVLTQRDAKAPNSGTPAPPQAAASAAVPPAPASLALNASATGVSRLISQANSGDAKSALALGLKYANGDGVALNDAEALRWLQKAAEAGQPVAQYRLGTFFEKGRAVGADQDKAMHWYGEAAKNGNRKAMHALGVANANGTGGKKNFPEAVRWFKAASELGLTDSQFNLAVLYERGLGVQASLSEAYKWYAIAAAAGDSESKTRIGALATQISAAERVAADRVAKDYKPQPVNVAANDGPPLNSN
jgi:localization factor PodJL